MVFHKRLFVGEKISDKDEIIRVLEDNTAMFNIFLICVSKKSNNMFDIMFCGEYFKEIYKDKEYIIVGIANGKKDAIDVVKRIFEWWLDGRCDLNGLKKYFI